MTSGPAIEPLRRLRPAEDIYADLEGQRRIIRTLLNLACEFYDRDMRPLVVADGHVERIGPDPLPQQLRTLLEAERARMERLESELYEARNRR